MDLAHFTRNPARKLAIDITLMSEGAEDDDLEVATPSPPQASVKPRGNPIFEPDSSPEPEERRQEDALPASEERRMIISSAPLLDPASPPHFNTVFTSPWAPNRKPDSEGSPKPEMSRPSASAAAQLASGLAYLSAAVPHIAEALADIDVAYGDRMALFKTLHVRL